ncbi:MAG TPA: GlsB/YeaQ/YmgE family stress response membrane protein [Ktedonobacterales bacterium]|nr:GlsB/YeaQ/YmgE family stress response membrane protein [Ktedonobacterales bacterium]
MILAAFTVTFSDLALQIIVGAIAAGLAGRAMRGGGFGIVGDLVIGVIGAIVANFVIGYFALFDLTHFGLMGELIVAIIGAILLVVLVHLATSRRSMRAEA